jgi:hypothetical protein
VSTVKTGTSEVYFVALHCIVHTDGRTNGRTWKIMLKQKHKFITHFNSSINIFRILMGRGRKVNI